METFYGHFSQDNGRKNNITAIFTAGSSQNVHYIYFRPIFICKMGLTSTLQTFYPSAYPSCHIIRLIGVAKEADIKQSVLHQKTVQQHMQSMAPLYG
ncbi:hypothetical protein SAMN04488054_101115 [Salibacterium qingdaonense]|uniref:Uncharacterized protein n=1 Tax=Salibacterium qingdaonense TaxID=266892 RepID=A0A1I4I1G1_9BACI|nr:hypothetical protein SAMN04488054_101115 [Salibacterium qingdaonense]